MKSDLSLVSVIMPVYNSAKYLNEAIDSILNQTYENIELIVIDDGSSDNSIELIKEYNSSKIRFYKNEKNIGVSATRNKAIDLSEGKFIALMDSDDISPPDRIRKQVEFLENNISYVLVAGHYESFTKYLFYTKRKLRKHCIIDDKIKVDLNFVGSIAAGTVLVQKEILDKNNLRFDSRLKIAEDFDFWRRISKYAKVTSIDELLVYYRKHPSNSIKQKKLVDNHMTLALKKSFNDLKIKSDDLFDNNEKLKNIESFSILLARFEEFMKKNNKTKEFNQKYLLESLSQLSFWFYKRHINTLGYELFKEYEKSIFYKNIKLRFRDKVDIYKAFIKSFI